MNKLFNIILFLLTIVSISCIEVAKNIDLSEGDPELVVQSYLSPNDSAIALILTLSKPIYQINTGGSDYNVVTNATVKISDENNEYLLSYNPDYRCYFSGHNQIKIVPGKEYKLYISSPDGKKVESSCIIPNSPTVKIELLKTDSSEGWNGMDYSRKFKLTNLSQEIKFFSIYRQYYSFQNFERDTFYYVQKELLIEIEPNSSTSFTLYDYSYDEFGSKSQSINDSLLVYQTDESYYRYHYTIENSYDGDPFSEPSITYSNISNGLGVFCAYNKKYIKVIK